MKTLWQHLFDLCAAKTEHYTPTGNEFLTFIDQEMARNPILTMSYGGHGLQATLADNTFVLLSPPAMQMDARPNVKYPMAVPGGGSTIVDPHVAPITGKPFGSQ